MEDSKVCFRCFAYIPKDSIYCPSCGINLNLRRANFLLKELSEKFKNQNLKKLFLSHPDFETINTLSSLHF
jgi:ribosomal protein L40E